MEQVCSLKGDYNGFNTDLTHAFATPTPTTFTPKSTTPRVLQPIVTSFVIALKVALCEAVMRLKGFELKWKTRSASHSGGATFMIHTTQHGTANERFFLSAQEFVEIWVTS